MYMYNIFLIHSSVNGHLGCFHVLDIVNKGSMNIRVYVYLNYNFVLIYVQEWDCWTIS